MRWIPALVVMAGCTKSGSQPASDPVVDDFRSVEQRCLERYHALLDLEHAALRMQGSVADSIQRQVIAPWKELRARVEAATPPASRADLYATMRHYLGEREAEWTAHAAADTDGVLEDRNAHLDEERAHAAAADTDARMLDAEFQKLGLTALPALPTDAGVALTPPPSAPAGAAYFLVGRQIVLLDGSGFRVIVTDVDHVDVLPDGTLWACSVWNLVHWDGTKATATRPKHPLYACAAAPDGTVRTEGPNDKTTQLLVDRDGVVYAIADDDVWAYADAKWKQLTAGMYLDHLTRGADGHVWLLHERKKSANEFPSALAQLSKSGLADPAWIDDYFEWKWLDAAIDASGTPTILDLEENEVVQGTRKRMLPVALTVWRDRNPGPFAYDAAGRLWVELADGLSVIAPDGTRTLYLHGSLDAFRERIAQIAVLGAGPTLPAPTPVVTRTITGVVANPDRGTLANAPVALCVDSEDNCTDSVFARFTTADAAGRFTIPDVPRWTYELVARVENHRYHGKIYDRWGSAEVPSDATDLGTVKVTTPLH